MKKRIKQLAAILTLSGLSLTGGVSFAVEWEMMDKFSVDGYSEFRGTVAVPSGGFTVGGSSFAVQYGKIGIGTSTPSFLLHISTAAGVAGDLVVISTGDINVIRMTGAGEIHANKFHGDGSGLSMVVASSVAANGVRPGSIVSGAIINTDINTAAEIAPTKIAGTAAVLGANTFTSSQTITGAGGLLATYGVSAATAAFTAQDASVPGVTISSGLIVSSGSIGIGTGSPNGKLSVKPAASDTFSLFISSQDGTTGNLVVAKSGNVGIGITNPGATLDVRGTNQLIDVWGSALAQPFSILAGNAVETSYKRGSFVGQNIAIDAATGFPLTRLGAYTAAAIGFAPYTGVGNSGIGFFTTANTSQNTLLTEVMRIDKSGYVGIGTASPTSLLHIKSAGTAGVVRALNLENPASYAANVGISIHSAVSNNDLGTITFTQNGSGISRIDFDAADTAPALSVVRGGNVGIGTTSPGYALDVNGAIRGLDVIAGSSAFSHDGLIVARNSGNASTIYIRANGDSFFTGGNVGIGTASPYAALSFGKSAGNKIGLWDDSGDWYGFGITGGQLNTCNSLVSIAPVGHRYISTLAICRVCDYAGQQFCRGRVLFRRTIRESRYRDDEPKCQVTCFRADVSVLGRNKNDFQAAGRVLPGLRAGQLEYMRGTGKWGQGRQIWL